ncbi:MAG TPA: hypothetical protein VNH16_13355 [Burkholderiales bacterium]|nr:hypothetical protein [Burkholderiales bacterium]
MSSYLFAWLLFLGLALGGMANLMLHNLSGGAWGSAVRPTFVAAARLVPLAALLGIPVLVAMRQLYPIGESVWFSAPFFAARSIAYLALWSAFGLWLRSSVAWSAIGLIVYVFTMSLAATDWIAALVPQWYSTGFGLVVAIGQMLGAMALAVAHAGLRAERTDRQVFLDLGNLLLMYVMTWAYLAFMQFLIVWVGNLPREIAWYLPRLQTGWVALGVILVVFHFFAPLAILLFRSAKRSPLLLGSLAAALLAVHVIDVYWLVAPSVRPLGFHIAVADILALLAAAALWRFAWRPARA